MPRKPLRACGCPGCRVLALPEQRYCAEHQPQHIDNRPSAAAQGYDAHWRTIRLAFLRRHPWCVSCGAVATEVHHIISRRRGGGDNPQNLRALCKRCHSRLTGRAEKIASSKPL
ncbi:MAG: HNH endonuclease [Actinobacteria bacterium]|nr:HNH endonuclease [Actinomycetota bacterium]